MKDKGSLNGCGCPSLLQCFHYHGHGAVGFEDGTMEALGNGKLESESSI